MLYAQRVVVGLGLLATGVSAATHHFEQDDAVGGCGYGGRSYNVRLGPPCPPGWKTMLIDDAHRFCRRLLGATIYAARGTADNDPTDVRREPYDLGTLQLFTTIAVAFVAAKVIHPGTCQFRPGPDVIIIAVGSVLVIIALGIRTARWWAGLGSPPSPPIVDQRIGAGRGNALPAAIASLVMYAAYLLQRSVGQSDRRPEPRASRRGRTPRVSRSTAKMQPDVTPGNSRCAECRCSTMGALWRA